MISCLSRYEHLLVFVFVFFKQKTAYEMRISDWSSDVCSSDLADAMARLAETAQAQSAALVGMSEKAQNEATALNAVAEKATASIVIAGDTAQERDRKSVV